MTKESEIDKFIQNLTEARFEEIFDTPEELEQFQIFLMDKAVPSKGYVIGVPLEGGGLFWLLFKIQSVTARRSKFDLELDGPEVFIPNEASDRSLPKECQNYPIWWLEEQFKKQNA